MIKADIVHAVMAASNVSQRTADAAVDRILEAMREALARGERIELRGFGVFEVRPRKGGVGRNLSKGTEMPIPPGWVVRFKAGKDLQGLSAAPPNPEDLRSR